MFVGHYSVSLASRAVQPAVPLWAFVLAAQLLDILWCLFVIAGVERVSAAPGTVEGLRFLDYPWSHSLAAAFVWGGIATQLASRAFAVPPRAATLLGLVVVSHWPLDFLVHRTDLPIYPGGEEYGLGLWKQPTLELVLEIGLFLAAGAFLLAVARSRGLRLWPLAAFLAFGTAFMIAMRQMPPPAEVEPLMLGAMGLVLYLGFAFLAWLAERPPRQR